MSRWSAITVAALCSLLPLAWLQFHWSNQLARAEHQRLFGYLETSSARFAEDLDDYLMRQPLRPVGPLNGPPEPFQLDPQTPGRIAFRAGPMEEWALAELDLPAMTKAILPDLFHHHYPGGAGLDFDAVIVDSSSPPRLIWASQPHLDAAGLGTPDINIGLLHYRPFSGGRRGERPPPRDPPDGPTDGPPGMNGPPGGDGRPPRAAGGPPPLDGPAPWRLLLRHRSGSLEQAVATTRNRNLMLSAAVLLLLVLAALSLLVSTRRAQELAHRQMEFVAGVSHELRTPLSVIGSASGNLADGIVSTPQQVRQYGTLIQNEGRRLNNMVDQIMRFARIQSGRFQLQLRPSDPLSIIQEAIATTAEDLQRAGMELTQNIPPDLPPILADSDALTHCLRNLLANAAIHASSGHSATISAAAASAVTITIDDKGPGIPPAEMKHLFEPFFRGRQALESQLHGFGLGLALAHRIATAHNATLTAENRPAGGARFILELPIDPQP